MLDRKVGAFGRRNCSYHQVLAANILGALRSLSLSLPPYLKLGTLGNPVHL